MIKPLVPKFRPDLSARSNDIAEKQVPVRLKPIVTAACNLKTYPFFWCSSHLSDNTKLPLSGANVPILGRQSIITPFLNHHTANVTEAQCLPTSQQTALYMHCYFVAEGLKNVSRIF